MSTPAKSPRHAHPRAPLRPEDATLVQDIETVMGLNARFADLSRDEYLEMIVLTGRAIARLQAIKQEALAHLHARALPAQLPVQVGPVVPVDSRAAFDGPGRESPSRLLAGG